jgi:hypothetical protein
VAASLLWSDASLPLALAHSPSGALTLLSLSAAPPAPGLPAGVQPPRLLLTPLWSGRCGSSPPRVCVFDGDGGETLLSLSFPGEGDSAVLRLGRGADGGVAAAEVVLRLPATHAAPLVASRGASGDTPARRDLLVLLRGGTLQLLRGTQALCAVSLPPSPQPQAAPGDDCEMEMEVESGSDEAEAQLKKGVATVVGLRGGCGTGVSLLLSTGDILRCVPCLT